MSPAELAPWLEMAQKYGVRSLKLPDVEVTMWPPTGPARQPGSPYTDDDFALAATEGLPGPDELAQRRKATP